MATRKSLSIYGCFLAFIVGRGNLGSLLAFWGLSNIFTYYSTDAGILAYSVNEW